MNLPQQWSDILPQPPDSLDTHRDGLIRLIGRNLGDQNRSLELRQINDATWHLIDRRYSEVIHAAITITKTPEGDYLDITLIYQAFRWNPAANNWYGGRCVNQRAPCVADADPVDTILPGALMMTIILATT